MTEEQLRLLVAYIDAAAEAVWNNGPYASERLENKKARLKEQLIETVQTKKEH